MCSTLRSASYQYSVQRHCHQTQKGFFVAGIKTKMEPMKYASFWILKRSTFLFIKKLHTFNFLQEIILIGEKISKSLDFYD